MTKDEVYLLIRELKRVFDLVRLVNVADTTQLTMTPCGDIVPEPRHCYASWRKDKRCENCISSKAFAKKEKMAKFEFVDDEAYHVVSMYLEIDAEPYVLEMVAKITDETLFGAYGKNEFVETIMGFNNKLYLDPLTATYNRRYYEDQLCGLGSVDAIAVIDVDNLKQINDAFGHAVGDAALRKVADILLSHTRDTGVAVRYGSDEFLMLFRQIPKNVFFARLEKTRRAVSEAAVEGHPGVTLSVSIGGYYCMESAAHAFPEADRLLYLAKAAKNDVRLATREK